MLQVVSSRLEKRSNPVFELEGPVLPLGNLIHYGELTPERLTLYLEITDTISATATCHLQYRVSGSSTWLPSAHDGGAIPMWRLTIGEIDAFAWPLIRLTPGITYECRATIVSDGVTNYKSTTKTTRSLPPAPGAVTHTIISGTSASAMESAINALPAGAVCLIESQDNALSDTIDVSCAGTDNNPIYIIGEARDPLDSMGVLTSRTGTILSHQNLVFRFIDGAANLVFERMTLEGDYINHPAPPAGSGPQSASFGFYSGGAQNQRRITIRNVHMVGVDRAIYVPGYTQECLYYNLKATGNNQWLSGEISSNETWDDDGIALTGTANCAFQCTMRGFGDTFPMAMQDVFSLCNHAYRNDVHMSGDDLTEVDFAGSLCTFCDNRSHNSMSMLSFDPLASGPFLACGNIAINIGRTPHKWNSPSSGQFIYNNTIIKTFGKGGVDGQPGIEAGWYTSGGSGNAQDNFGNCNNIIIYQNSGGQTLSVDFLGPTKVDWTNNAWFPNQYFGFHDHSGANLAAVKSGMPATTPVRGISTHRMDNDFIIEEQPFTDTITLGANYLTEITTFYTPILRSDSVGKYAGIIIPGVTDGFSGSAPDVGAIIEGQDAIAYGDQS